MFLLPRKRGSYAGSHPCGQPIKTTPSVYVHPNREQLNGFASKLISKHFMKHCRFTSWRISKVKYGLCWRCTEKMSVLFRKMQRSFKTRLRSCLVITRNTSVRIKAQELQSSVTKCTLLTDAENTCWVRSGNTHLTHFIFILLLTNLTH